MHSRVFQISTTQIDKENYLNEDTPIRATTVFTIIVPTSAMKSARKR